MLTLTGTATIANYQTALESITYSVSPANADPTNGGSDLSRTIDWVVTDGNSGNGISNTGSSTLTEEHVAPSITAGATVTFIGGGGAVVLDSKITLADPDSGGMLSGATISIASGHASADLLNFSTQNGITGSYNSTTGVLVLTGPATVAQFQAALKSITYSVSPSNADPTNGGADTSRTIDWTVSDGNTGNGISNTATSTVDTLHVAPTGSVGGTVTFTGGGAAVALDPAVTVNDADSGGVLSGATISIGAGFASIDVLNFSNELGITGSYNASSGVLTLSGTATIANYQTALESISYSVSPSNADPTVGGGDLSRTINWVVSDPASFSNLGSSTVTAVHVAPTISTGGTVTYAAGGTAAVLDPTLTVTDVDSGGNITGATIAVGAGFIAGDLLNFSNQNGITGSYNTSTGVLTLSGTATIANYQAALDAITYTFTPANGDPTVGNTDSSRVIDWTVTDGSSSNGISNTGSSTLDVTRRPPVITGTVGGQTTTDEAALDPFAALRSPIRTGQTETVTVTLSNAANGTFSDSIGGSVTGGTYTVTGTTLAVTGALDGLVFTPTAHQVAPGSTVTSSFTIKATDTNGVSATDSTTTVIATAVNDPASLSGTLVNVGVANQGTLTPFTPLTVNDPDVGHTDTVTITLANPAFGAVSNLGGGSYNSTTGVYTLTSTPGADTTAIEGLVITPAAPPQGTYVTSTTLTVGVTGPGGGPAPVTAIAAAVQQVLGLAAVPLNKIAISVVGNADSFAAPIGGDTNEAVVTAPTGGGTYVLPTGYQAAFLGGSAAATLLDNTVGNAVLVGNTGNDTIASAAANDTLLGGNGNNALFGGSGTVALIAGNGSNVVNAAAGSTYTVSLGSGNDSVYAAGSGTITGGVGDNLFALAPGSGTNRVNSNGDDLIYAGGTQTNVSITGTDAVVAGGTSGTLDVSVSGTLTTVFGSGETTNVTTAGADGLFVGGTAALSVTDHGTADTIAGANGGGGAVTVSATTAPWVFGGSGSLLVLGGAGTPTVVGGSGGASISGGAGGVIVAGGSGTPTVTGAATLYGAAGGLIDYDGTAGGASYYAGVGAETLNASLSTANNLLVGSGYSAGADVITTGTGRDTVIAGLGAITVNAAASPFIFGGSGNLRVIGGAGTPTVAGGSGGASISGGAGGVVVGGGSGTPTVSGAATLYGSAGGMIDYTGSSGGLIYAAGSGAETLNAASSFDLQRDVWQHHRGQFGGADRRQRHRHDGCRRRRDHGGGHRGGCRGRRRRGADVHRRGGGLDGVWRQRPGLGQRRQRRRDVRPGGRSGDAERPGDGGWRAGRGDRLQRGERRADLLRGGRRRDGERQRVLDQQRDVGRRRAGGDVLVGGSGNDAVDRRAGGRHADRRRGADLFVFLTGRAGGTDVITDFNPADTVDLIGYGAGAAAAAEQSAVVSGGIR